MPIPIEPEPLPAFVTFQDWLADLYAETPSSNIRRHIKKLIAALEGAAIHGEPTMAPVLNRDGAWQAGHIPYLLHPYEDKVVAEYIHHLCTRISDGMKTLLKEDRKLR
jgi:hypothetical protein